MKDNKNLIESLASSLVIRKYCFENSRLILQISIEGSLQINQLEQARNRHINTENQTKREEENWGYPRRLRERDISSHS